MTSKKYRCPTCNLKGTRTNSSSTFVGVLSFYDKRTGRKHKHDDTNRISESFECRAGHTWNHSRIGSNCWCGWRPEDSEDYQAARAAERRQNELVIELIQKVPGVGPLITFRDGQIYSYEVNGQWFKNPDYVAPLPLEQGYTYVPYVPVYRTPFSSKKDKKKFRDEFSLKKRLPQRIAKLTRPEFYGRVSVEDLKD